VWELRLAIAKIAGLFVDYNRDQSLFIVGFRIPQPLKTSTKRLAKPVFDRRL